MRVIALSLAALALAGAASPPPVLTRDGLGALRIGMTETQARAAVGGRIGREPDADEACKSLALKGEKGVYLMFESGVLTRITLMPGARFKTDHGLGVGATEAQLRAAYGGKGLTVIPHAYEAPPARYFTAWDSARRLHGVKYATDPHRVVNEIDAGGESIRYVEGCA